jgi:hypothetical protein
VTTWAEWLASPPGRLPPLPAELQDTCPPGFVWGTCSRACEPRPVRPADWRHTGWTHPDHECTRIGRPCGICGATVRRYDPRREDAR